MNLKTRAKIRSPRS